jgi:hypothetical protein
VLAQQQVAELVVVAGVGAYTDAAPALVPADNDGTEPEPEVAADCGTDHAQADSAEAEVLADSAAESCTDHEPEPEVAAESCKGEAEVPAAVAAVAVAVAAADDDRAAADRAAAAAAAAAAVQDECNLGLKHYLNRFHPTLVLVELAQDFAHIS